MQTADPISVNHDLQRVSEANDRALRAIRNPTLRGEFVRHVVDAIYDLNENKADIILLAARRMSTLYVLLQRTGLPALERGRVVSDRFIHLLPDEAWKGKRVILLDDTRLTGATIADRADKARSLVGGSGRVSARIALDLSNEVREGKCSPPAIHAANAKRLHDAADEVVVRLPMGIDEAKDAQYDPLALHTQFAKAFGSNLTPFFTDFAVSEEFSVPAAVLERILASPNWRVVDVTSGELAGSGSLSFSLFPAGEFQNAVQAGFGDAVDLVDVAKVRLFIDEEFGIVRVRFVPLVLTHNLAKNSVQKWVGNLDFASISDESVSAAGGLIATLLSKALFEVFARLLERDFGVQATEDLQMAKIALGPDLFDFTQKVIYNGISDTLSKVSAISPVRPVERLRFAWGDHDDCGNHFVIAGDNLVKSPFDRLHRLKERLLEGKSPDEIRPIPLKEMRKLTGNSSITLSVALDVLNDLGYCVPSFTVDGESVVRVYRAGESVVAFRELQVGAFGGKLASIAETVEIPDEEYFGDPVPGCRQSRCRAI